MISSLAKSHLPITYFPTTQSFWIFSKITAVILLCLPCSVQNFKMIGQLQWILPVWTIDISWDLSLRWVSDRYAILQRPPGLTFPVRSRTSPSPDMVRKSSPAAAWATSGMYHTEIHFSHVATWPKLLLNYVTYKTLHFSKQFIPKLFMFIINMNNFGINCFEKKLVPIEIHVLQSWIR